MFDDDYAKRTTTRAVRGTSILYFQGLISSVVSLAFAMLITRILNKIEVGNLYAIITFIGILTTLASISVFSGVTKFIAESLGRGNKTEANQMAAVSFTLGLFTSFTMTIAMWLLLPVLFNFLGVQLSADFPWALLGLDMFCTSIIGFFSSSLQGAREYNRQAILLIASNTLRYGISIIFLLGGGGINGVIIGWALGNVIGTGLMVAFTVVIFRPISRPTFFDLNRIMRYSAPLTLSMIVGLINANIDKIMLLGFLDTGSLGVYSTGLSIAFFLTIAGSALYSVSLTEQSWAWSGGKEKLDRIAETVLQYVFLTYIPLSVILAILAVPAATVLFTIAYVESFIVVALIGITKSVFCYDIIANGYLLAMGKTHYFLYGSFIAAISQTLLGYFLIPLSGLTGATIARCIGIAILSLYPISIMRFRYEFAFDAKYQLKIIIVSYLAAIPAYLFVISFEPLVAILGSSFIFGGLYFLGLRVGRLVTVRNVETYTLLLPKIIQHHFYLIGTKLLTRCEDQIEHSKNE